MGAALGSFLNVVVRRFHKKQSIRGRSKCNSCNEELKVRDLIPVISYLWLRGKCRNCNNSFSVQYALVELILGALFVWIAYMHVMSGDPAGPSYIVRDWYIVWVLGFIFLYDLLFMKVDDRIVIPGIITVFLISGMMQWQSWSSMLLGAAVGGGFFLVQYVVSRGRWVGSGDIVIGVFMGVVLGWPLVMVGLLLAYVIGAIVSVGLLSTGKKTRTDKMPFGVYLAFGTFLAMFWGGKLMSWYIGFLV